MDKNLELHSIICPQCGESEMLAHGYDIVNALLLFRCLKCFPLAIDNDFPKKLIGPISKPKNARIEFRDDRGGRLP